MSSYRLGLVIVVGVVLAAAVTCLATVDTSDHARASQDLGKAAQPLGTFLFTERSGSPISNQNLQDRVWVAAFIFTRCRSSCPVITAAMSRLQADLADSPVQLVSITVDPEHDTPQILAEFAGGYRADPERWWFLTGDREATYELIRTGFQLGVTETTQAERSAGAEAFGHSSRLALIDRGNKVVGFYDSNDAAQLETLVDRARTLAQLGAAPAWAKRLPAINATLNALSALLLFLGWTLIRSNNPKAHRLVMVLALALSAAFLACYLVYHSQVGSVRFAGLGTPRLVYFTILLSHTVLAVAMVPMILLTVLRAAREQFDRHRRIATITYPIWLYVSITGVVIYLMLYQIDWTSSAAI